MLVRLIPHKSICDRCLKILQHLSSSNLPSLAIDNHLEKLISLSATRSIRQADVGSPCWKNLGSLIVLSREVIHVAYGPSIYVLCLPFGYPCLAFSSSIETCDHVSYSPSIFVYCLPFG